MKDLGILSLLLICFMIFGFTEELNTSCYQRCMKETKRATRKAHHCVVREGLKEVLVKGKGGKLIKKVLPGSREECGELFKESVSQMGEIDKNCRAKCQ